MAFKPIEILINAKDNASAVFGSLQTKVVAVGAAIATYFGINAFAGVVKGAADLESAMSRVQAATGATGAELAALRKAAEDAGAGTKFSSTEAADALAELGKAGLTSAEAIQALRPIINAATADGVGLAEASSVVTSAIMGMGLSFSDAGSVADILARGAAETKTSIVGLGQALSYAAPAANGLGLSLEATTAIIGQFAQGGIDASRAGTALNSILSQFADPASKFRTELAAAGITTNNFEKALHELAAVGPAGSKAINAVGLEAGPALRAMLNLGMGALDELKAKLGAAGGSAEAAAATMRNNLNGALSGLESAWTSVKVALGTPVLPILKDGVEQLAGALRGAVSDGTVKKFGDAIAAAFQAGIKWFKEFLATVDFEKLAADLRGFADRTGEAFTQIGTYATNAGNIVQLAYGVMSAGFNAVLGVIYKVGEAFAGLVSHLQSGVALIMEGLSQISFGSVSAAFKSAADEVRLSAEATMAASDALGEKSRQAFLDMADGAQTARDGFDGLSRSFDAGGKAAADAQASISALAKETAAGAAAAAAAGAAYQTKANADLVAQQASDQHRAAIATLRAEYDALIAAGNLQEAAKKFQEIEKAQRGVAKAADDAAAAIAAAYKDLGIVTDASLRETADRAKKSFDLLKASGTASAREIADGFADAAKKAIAANNSIAPSWVTAEAAVRGYRVEVDEAGKTTLVLRDSIEKVADSSSKAGDGIQADWKGVESSVRSADQALADYQRRLQKGAGGGGGGGGGGKGLFDEGRKSSRGEELGKGVEEIGSSGSNFRNKDGMTSDAKGNVQQQFVWTRSAIIDYLQQAGLEDVVAEELSKQFLNAQGGVDYEASSAQKRWAGKYGTLAEALGKVAEYSKYDEAGKIQAQDIVDRAKRDKEIRDRQRNPNAPAPSPTPAPAPGPGTGTGGSTYINNITINGVGDWGMVRGQTRHTDADSAKTEIDLLRSLAQARGAAIQ